MKVVQPTASEMAWRSCKEMLMLNPMMMNTYYTTLFETFKSLLNPEHRKELQQKIKDVEDWLSDDYNKLTLREVELRMFNNLDLLSGFQVDGKMITQMEINERLEEIKQWLTQLLYMYLPYIRFTRQVDM